MPQGYYYPQYYNTTATTTNYIPMNTQWYQAATISPNTIWQQWINTSNSTAITVTGYQTYANEAWVRWTDQVWQTSYTPARVYTPEEAAEMEAQQQRHRAITEERHQRRLAARTRARLLLEEFLDDEQKLELERHGRFFVTGSRGRRYCIRAEGQSGNVDLLKPDGSVQARLCCHPRSVPGEASYESLPEGDAWLMQMIEIRHDEDHFLRTANVHRGSLPVAA
jgi:hypothetical protein